MLHDPLQAAKPAEPVRIDDAVRQVRANLQPSDATDRSLRGEIASVRPPDRDQIARHLDALFRHAPPGSFISFRAFFHNPRTERPSLAIRFVPCDAPDVLRSAFEVASAAATSAEPAAFYAPHAVFKDTTSAKTSNLAAALVLSVECDERPAASVQKLADVLGQPTLVLASGGTWVEGEGRSLPKLHAHWRLAAPAVTVEDLDRVKLTRKRMRLLAGSDPTCDPVVHPLRIAGGWHTKNPAAPRPVCIVACDPEREISLDDAFALMAATVPEIEQNTAEAKSHVPEDLLGEEQDIAAALEVIPNDNLSWDAWKRILMAIFNASGGAGADLALTWSAKSEKDDPDVTLAEWEKIGACPADHLGMATLILEAREAQPGWVKPSLRFDSAKWFERQHESLFLDERSDVPTTPSRTYNFMSLREAAGSALTVFARPLIQGLIHQGTMSVWYGPPKSYKTFVLLDVAYHIASGRPWAGRKVTQGKIVYIIGEGGQGVGARAGALLSKHGDCADFILLSTRINLFDRNADLRPLTSAIKALEGVCFVALDTLARVMAGADENSSKDMGVLIANADEMRVELGCHLAIVHHTGKDESRGARGSNALLGAIDTGVMISGGVIEVTNQRDFEIMPPIQFEIETVGLGRNVEGDAITSATIRLQEGSAAPTAGVIPPRTARVLEALSPFGGVGAKVGELIVELKGAGHLVSPDSVTSALKRLEKLGRVSKQGRGVWVALQERKPATSWFEKPNEGIFA